jgi:hypothetical protein
MANWPTGPQPQIATVSPSLICAFSAAIVACWENVGQKECLLICDIVRNLNRPDISHGHAEVFGLAARVASQHMAEAEQAGWRLPHGLARHLCVGICSITARIESLLTEPTLTTADRKRNYDPVADRKVRDLGAEFNHLAHILMTEYVSALHVG